MKNLNKIKGLTLIEVMILMSLIIGFILIFINMDMTTNEKQNTRKVGTQLNMIVSGIDKRISIEGKSFSYWKNGTSWTGNQFKDFLKQELVGANNKTCGNPSKGWQPSYSISGLDDKKGEGENVVTMYSNALNGKLIPCTLWTVYPYDIVPTAKITADAKGDLASVLLSFKFANVADWKSGFAKFNESYLFAKEQKNTTLLTTKSFYYTDSSQNQIDMKQCIILKDQCSMNLKVTVGSSSTDDKKFKVDSSNSFETNLGFAKSVKENQQVNCTIWTMDTSVTPPKWDPRITACGVTGGSNGDKEVGLIGDNIDAQNIKITGRCIDYQKNFPITGTDYNSECGLIDNGTIVELNSSILHASKVVANSLNVNTESNINNIAVKEADDKTSITTTVDTMFKSSGKSLLDIKEAKQLLTETERKSLTNVKMFDPEYRPTPAAVSFETKRLDVKNLNSEVESILTKNFKTTNLSLKNKMYTEKSTEAEVLVVNNQTVTNTLNPYKDVEIKDSIIAADPDNKNNITGTSSQKFEDIVSESTGIILGDISANNIKVKGTSTSEQLNFRLSYVSEALVKVSKSINFDSLANKYIYPKGFMAGWGAEGYNSNSGIYAKKFKLNGDLTIKSTAPDTGAYIYEDNWGFAQNYMGYRNGIELTYDKFPDTRGMFYMNDMGKVLASGYYDTGKHSGIRIGGGFNGSGNGSGFFWGRDPKLLVNEFGDRRIYANLSSSIYGYNVGDDITALNNGYKMIVNNLTVYAALGANLYSGAYYHGGLPKILSGSTITNTDVPINYVSSGVGEYWETADGIFLRNLNWSINYYLNRISYIYGQYVNLNKIGTIKGSKGDRGSRGQTGVNGIKGETGSQGIPGAVGDRG